MAYTHRRNRLWASESCTSVDVCTRTVGVVHIPHAVCARHLRYVYTHARFYGVSTLTDAHSREPTIGDGLIRLRCLETVCVRSPHVQTECLHEATARDGVCTTKCDNPRTCTCLCDIIKTARTWFLPLGLYMLVRALFRMHVSHWLAQFSISIWIYFY